MLHAGCLSVKDIREKKVLYSERELAKL